MIYTLTIAERERRELLVRLATDVAAHAAIVKSEGSNLSPRQRDDIELLVIAARVVRDGLTAEASA